MAPQGWMADPGVCLWPHPGAAFSLFVFTVRFHALTRPRADPLCLLHGHYPFSLLRQCLEVVLGDQEYPLWACQHDIQCDLVGCTMGREASELPLMNLGDAGQGRPRPRALTCSLKRLHHGVVGASQETARIRAAERHRACLYPAAPALESSLC